MAMRVTTVLGLVAILGSPTAAELYCGAKSCYTVLGVESTAEVGEIRKAYRKLSIQHHPDRGGTAEKFMEIAQAYEILKDDESRKNHDYYLAHPEEHLFNQYQYYKHKATPKVGLTPIFLVLVTLISVVQWFYWSHRHSQMLREAMGHTQLRRQAKKIADDNELLKGKSKDEIEKILQEIILDNLDVHGRCGKPDIHAVLWVQIVKSPYTFSLYLWWHVDWYMRISWRGEEYTDDDRIYLIRRNLGLSEVQWNCVSEEMKDEAWDAEAWDSQKCTEWQQAKAQEQHEKIKNSAQYKRYKRWQKKMARS